MSAGETRLLREKRRILAESSTPAIPMTRWRGNPLNRYTACDIASSGLATGTMMRGRMLDDLGRYVLRMIL